MAKTAESPRTHADYAERYLPMRQMFFWVIGLVIGLAVVEAVVYYLYGTPHQHPVPEQVLSRTMNQPTLQPDPKIRMRAFLAEQKEQLSTYGWVNKAQGVVRLPIDKAIDMVVQKGLPARKEAKP